VGRTPGPCPSAMTTPAPGDRFRLWPTVWPLADPGALGPPGPDLPSRRKVHPVARDLPRGMRPVAGNGGLRHRPHTAPPAVPAARDEQGRPQPLGRGRDDSRQSGDRDVHHRPVLPLRAGRRSEAAKRAVEDAAAHAGVSPRGMAASSVASPATYSMSAFGASTPAPD
jgi:hypothetical protein